MLIYSNLSRYPFLGQVAFHLQPIGLQTLVAIDSESYQTSFDSFPSFCAQAALRSHVKSLCCSIPIWANDLSLDRSSAAFSALHRSPLEICGFVPMSYFYSETNDSEWSKDWAKQWVLFWSATSSCQFHRKFHFTWNKKWLVAALYLQSIKTSLTLELSHYCKSGNMFSLSKPVAASRDCNQLGNALCLILPVLSAQAVQEHCPLILQSKLSIVFWNSLLECLPDDLRAQTWQWTQTWTLQPDQLVVKVLSAPKSQNKVCGVWILFRSVKNVEFEDSTETVSILILQTGLGLYLGFMV